MNRNLKRAILTAGVSTAVVTCVSTALVASASLRFVKKWRSARARRTLSGQVVLITGGSRGLGFALAQELSDIGCHVVICARDEKELKNAKALLAQRGAEVLTFSCDVTDHEDVSSLIDKVTAHFGRIDILINNAGEISVAPLENMTVADFERAMAVMFWGVVYPTLEVIDEMKARGSGRIATITSIGGKVSIPHLLPYCCAKFAAVGFCEGLRAEMAPYGVKVTTIAPGLMRTGSHLKAEFKGNQQAESTWFGLGATLPGISMSAERAAKQIVRAIERGQSEKILSTQASLLARMNSAFPGFVPELFGLVGRLLPQSTDDRRSRSTGAELQDGKSFWFQALTVLGQRAADRLNQTTGKVRHEAL